MQIGRFLVFLFPFLNARFLKHDFQSRKSSRLYTFSSYENSGDLTKSIVATLTNLAVVFKGKPIPRDRVYYSPNISPKEMLNGIRADFERGYLFSGEINSELYDEECRFTDPTISFTGLTTFENNIKSLQPLLENYIRDSMVILYAIALNETSCNIKAKWRMSANLKLPWKPKIELTGQTTFTYNPGCNGRIVDYYEIWDIPALNVLIQLIQSDNGRNNNIHSSLKYPGNSSWKLLYRSSTEQNKEHAATSESTSASATLIEDIAKVGYSLQFLNETHIRHSRRRNLLVDVSYIEKYSYSQDRNGKLIYSFDSNMNTMKEDPPVHFQSISTVFLEEKTKKEEADISLGL
eukprot:gene11898-24928_t